MDPRNRIAFKGGIEEFARLLVELAVRGVQFTAAWHGNDEATIIISAGF